MNKTIKILIIIFSSLLSLLLLLLLAGVILLHNVIEENSGEPVTYFQAVKFGLSLNFDGKLERKAKHSKEMKVYENMSIYVDDQDVELFPLIIDTLHWAKDRNADILGDIDGKDVDLLFFHNKKDFESISDLNHVSGFYDQYGLFIAVRIDDKKGILDGKETPLYFFQKRILHEYTHYALDQKVADTPLGLDKYPLWFQEGIAEYISNDQTTIEVSDFKLLTYDQLRSHEQWAAAREQKETDVYDQSYFTIKFLIDEQGEEVIEEIIDSTNDSGDFKESFADVTGLDYDRLYEKLEIKLGKEKDRIGSFQ
ncbi:collagenase [Pseudalkalibacillus sp. JSM 102089]|uniref:collagenase n=1 Tax=Pseudalkalibacillus sp. JSM 102089 TaxID=3229856 RepID=UPI0035234850